MSQKESQPHDSNAPRYRFDQAHRSLADQSNRPITTSVEMLSTVAGIPLENAVGVQFHDQMQRHAASLEDRLRSQQQSLRRRESEFDARAAQIENELRTSRLMIREREFELNERSAELEASLAELRQHNTDLVAAQVEMEAAAASQNTSLRTSVNDARISVETWQKRVRDIERDERLLKARLGDIDSRQAKLDAEEERLRIQQREYTTRLSADRAADRERIEQHLLELQRRTDEVERRRVSVAQLHTDVSKMYREAIEIRICTEELWGQMSDLSPAELTSRLGQLRQKLNDRYAMAEQSLVERHREILTLLERLEHHEHTLSGARAEVQGWASRRQEEIERQANKLLQRERELDAMEANLRHSERQWQQDREELEQELRLARRR